MRLKTTLGAAALAALAASAAAPSVALAETYAIATFVEPSHPITRFQHVEFADRVREASKGEINFEVFSGGTLLPAGGTLQGIADGVAQVSILPPSYAPSALPLVNTVNDLGWLHPDPLALAFAYADFNFNEEVARNDWMKNGVLYGAGHATPVYRFMCKGEVRTLEDIKGKRTRMPGATYSRFGDAIGVTSVNLSASEIYTAMERGAIDCVTGDVTHLQSGATIGELVDTILMIEMSPYFSSAGLMYDLDFWRGLTDDQRRLLLDEGARSMVRLTMAYLSEEQQALAWAEENGIELVEADPALVAAQEAWVAEGVAGGMAEFAKTQYGLEDPEAVFALFRTYLDKWEGLLAGVDRSDEAALTALVKTNVTDKVDVATYGMN